MGTNGTGVGGLLSIPQRLRRDHVELDHEYLLIDKCSDQVHCLSHAGFVLEYLGIQSHIERYP